MLLEKKEDVQDPSVKGHLLSGGKQLCEAFYNLHSSCDKNRATPRQYLNLLHTYVEVFDSKKGGIETRRNHLQVN